MPITLERAARIAVSNHYQLPGNNVHRLPGVEFTPTGPGQLEVGWPGYMRAVGDAFVVMMPAYTAGVPYRAGFHEVFVEVFRTEDWAQLQQWLEVNGKRSEGGQPAGSCGVWD